VAYIVDGLDNTRYD